MWLSQVRVSRIRELRIREVNHFSFIESNENDATLFSRRIASLYGRVHRWSGI
jgi:hypothetical protein